MAGMDVEQLNIRIQSDSTAASQALDNLIQKLERLQRIDLSGVKTAFSHVKAVKTGAISGYSELAKSIEKIGSALSANSGAFADLQRVGSSLQNFAEFIPALGDTSKLVTLANSLSQLGKVDSQKLVTAGDALRTLMQGMSGIQIDPDALANIQAVAQVLASISSRSGKRYTADFQALATGLERLFQVLARAPTISTGTVKALQAVGNLNVESVKAAAGMTRLSASTARYAMSARRSAVNTHSLTSRLAFAIGRFRQIYFLVRRVANFFGKMIGSAMEYVEVLNYFNAAFSQVAARSDEIFGEAGEEAGRAFANRFADEAAKLTEKMSGYTVNESGMVTNTMGTSLGMNPATMMSYQATFAQMASSMGVSSQTATDLSRALTEIGADLASVRNMDYESTWKNLQSGLVGMSRAVDKFGVNIRNVNLQQKLTDLGIEANIQSMNQQDKALLRTIIILENSQYAWGDLADTLQQPANQMRMLKAGLSNLGRTIGNVLLPMVAAALPYINAFVIALQKLFENLVGLMGIEFDWGSMGGAAIDSDWADYLDETAEGYSAAAEAAEEYKNQLLGFDEINKLGSESGSDNAAGGASGGAAVTGALESALRAALDAYQKVWDQSYANVSNHINEMAQKIVDALEEGNFEAIGESISKWITNGLNRIDWEEVKKSAYNVGAKFADFLNGFATQDLFTTVGRTIAESLNAAVQHALGFGETFDWYTFGKNFGNGLSEFLIRFDFRSLVKAINVFVRGFAEAFFGALRGLKLGQILSSVLDAILAADPVAISIVIGALSFKKLGGAVIATAGAALKGVISSALGAVAGFLGPVGLTALGAIGITTGIVLTIRSIIARADEAAFQEFYQTFAPISSTLKDATTGLSEFKESITTKWGDVETYTGYLDDLVLRFDQLSQKSGLTKDQQNELNGIIQTLSEKLPGFNKLIDEQTGAYKGTSDQLRKLVKLHENYYRMQALSGILEEYTAKQTEVGLQIYKSRREIEKLRPVAEAYSELIQNKGAYSAETYAEALNGLIETYGYLGLETEEDFEKASRAYDEAQTALAGYQQQWDEVTGEIETIKSYSEQVVTAVGNIGAGIQKGTERNSKVANSSGRIMASNILNGFKNTLEIQSPSKVMERMGGFIVQGLANGLANTAPLTNPLQTLYNRITGMFSYNSMKSGLGGIISAFNDTFGEAANASVQQYNKLAASMNNSTVNGKAAVRMSHIPMAYANGGFPEDGFFWANSTEMVGRFSNGRTAVANNEQIIAGIEGGVARGMAQVLMSGAMSGGQNGQPVEVTITVDSETLYRATLRGQSKYNNRYHMTTR